MTTKICHQCRGEADVLAKVCPHCRAKLGSPGKNGVAKKPTSFVVGCLAVFIGFGVIGAVSSAIFGGGKPAPTVVAKPAEPVDPKYGKKPDTGAIQYLLNVQLPQGMHDPSSFQDLEVYRPEKDTIKLKGKSTDCWRVPFSFRAKNGFGALRQSHGTLWMRDDNLIQQKISD